jgi:hypothetical protein
VFLLKVTNKKVNIFRITDKCANSTQQVGNFRRSDLADQQEGSKKKVKKRKTVEN